jgi:hypothetical protein
MSTQRQIDANRRNAAHSTGPRSPEGKARSSRNALKTGLYAEGNVIRGESTAALQLLAEQFHAEYHPVTPTERSLVDTLIQSEWMLRRCRWLETEVWRAATATLTQEELDTSVMGCAFGKHPPLARVHRLRNAAQRQFFDALNALLRLRRLEHDSVDPIPLVPSRPALLRPISDPPEPVDTEGAYPEIGFVPPNPAQPPDSGAIFAVDQALDETEEDS